MTGGADRPPLDQPAWGLRHLVPTFYEWLGFSPEVGCELAFSMCFLGWPASPRPVSLALARLSSSLPCNVDPGSCDAPQVGSGLG